MIFPTKKQIVKILREHPLIKLKGKVNRAFVVGSFAKRTENHMSDIDILLEVFPVIGYTENELTEKYRKLLQRYFMENDIHEQMDDIHPQWNNRRIDLYFTYDISYNNRPKIELK